MKLVVDINPFLERNYTIEKFDSGKEVTAKDYNVILNDTSISSIKILDIFGVDYLLLTVLGGDNGIRYEKLLKDNLIEYKKVPIRDNIQERILISSDQRSLDIKTEEPRITMEEINELYSSYSDILSNVDFVIISDSSDTERSLEFLENLINIAYKASTKIGVISNPTNVKGIIKSKPYLIVLGPEELEAFSDREISYEWETTKVCKGILESGVGNVLLVKSNREISLYNSDEILRATLNTESDIEINRNKVISAFVSGLSKGYDNSMSLSLGLAASKLDPKNSDAKYDAAGIKMLLKEIKVERFNA